MGSLPNKTNVSAVWPVSGRPEGQTLPQTSPIMKIQPSLNKPSISGISESTFPTDAYISILKITFFLDSIFLTG